MPKPRRPASVWVVSDQGESWRIYTGFVRLVFRVEGRTGGCRHRYVQQGDLLRYPDEAVHSFIRGIRDKLEPGDRFLVLLDSEDRDEASLRRSEERLGAVRKAFSGAGFGGKRVHTALIPPMTEVLYLLDERLAAVVASTLGLDPGGIEDLERIGSRRMKVDIPPKKDVQDALRASLPGQKTKMAQAVEREMDTWGALPPVVARMPCLQNCRKWLLRK